MAVNLHTNHFRFGINSGTESSHGWHANEDVNPAQGVIAVDTTFLLRFNEQETGGSIASNIDAQFQYRKNGGAWTNITTTSSNVKAVDGILTNGGNCTKRLSGTGTFESSGAGQTEDGSSGGTANDIAASGCSETECALQIVGADVVTGDVIEFRLTSPDTTITNDVVPSITVQETVISEADGSSAGTATDSVVAAAYFAGGFSSVGQAATAIAAVAIWLVIAASSGLAGDSVAGALVVDAESSSAAAATDSVVGASVYLSAAESAGAASDSIVAASISTGEVQSSGSAAVSADGEAVLTGSDANAAGIATDSILTSAIATSALESTGLGTALSDSGATALAEASSVGLASDSMESGATKIADMSAAGIAVAVADGRGLSDHVPIVNQVMSTKGSMKRITSTFYLDL